MQTRGGQLSCKFIAKQKNLKRKTCHKSIKSVQMIGTKFYYIPFNVKSY